MKKPLVAVLALFASLTFAQAQTNDATATAPATTTDQQSDRVKIKTEDLPEAVKKSLNSDDYRGWLVSAAYEIKSKNRYEVELKNGADFKTLVFDKEGKKID